MKEHTERRLAKRNLPTETAAYADLNPVTVFEESVGMTPEHFTETVSASLPAKAEDNAPDPEEPSAESIPEKIPTDGASTLEIQSPADEPETQTETEPVPPDEGKGDET